MFTLIVASATFIAGAMLSHIFRPLIVRAWTRIKDWFNKQPRDPTPLA